jgi:hypothetical protein
MRGLSDRVATAAALMALAATAPLLALGGKVLEVRSGAGQVRAAIELGNVFGADQRAVLQQGGTLHVRVEAGVWEDRPVFDRSVDTPRVTTFRIVRQPNGAAIAVIDPQGGVVTYRPYPERLPLVVDVCGVQKIEDHTKYYVDGAITVGSLGADELEEANEAVFGRDEDPAGLKRVGKFLLNSVLQMKNYVGSVSTEIRSGRFTSTQLVRP